MAGLFIKLDVDFWDHPKIVTAGVAAGVLYQRMSMYCMQHTTDGFVPAAQLPRFALPSTAKLTVALVDVGLIEPAVGGWMVPGYVERYASSAELEHRRQSSVENGRKGGRPRNPTETQGVSAQVRNGLRDTKPNRKQEVEVDVDVDPKESSSSETSAARPRPDDDEDVATRLIGLTGVASPPPTPGERATITAAMAKGWTVNDLEQRAARAGLADVAPRAYLLKLLTDCVNTSPDAGPGRVADPRPLLDDERTHCTTCSTTGWVDVGGGVDRCPDCAGARA